MKPTPLDKSLFRVGRGEITAMGNNIEDRLLFDIAYLVAQIASGSITIGGSVIVTNTVDTTNATIGNVGDDSIDISALANSEYQANQSVIDPLNTTLVSLLKTLCAQIGISTDGGLETIGSILTTAKDTLVNVLNQLEANGGFVVPVSTYKENLDQTPVSISVLPAKITGITCINNSSANGYLKIYNSASSIGTDNPALVIPVPQGASYVNLSMNVGLLGDLTGLLAVFLDGADKASTTFGGGNGVLLQTTCII